MPTNVTHLYQTEARKKYTGTPYPGAPLHECPHCGKPKEQIHFLCKPCWTATPTHLRAALSAAYGQYATDRKWYAAVIAAGTDILRSLRRPRHEEA